MLTPVGSSVCCAVPVSKGRLPPPGGTGTCLDLCLLHSCH